MSDIGISPGLFALVVALWTVALGLGACVLLALAGFLMAMPEGETRGRRIRRWTAGPAACAVTGAVAGFVLQGAVSDTLAWLIPALGLIAWVVVAFRLRAPANSPMMGALKEPRLKREFFEVSYSLFCSSRARAVAAIVCCRWERWGTAGEPPAVEAPLAAGAVIERTITSDIQGMDISAGPAISFLVDSATYTFSYYYPFPPDSGVRSGSITTSDDRTLTCTDRDATESSGHSQATEPTELDEVKDQLQSMTRY